MSGKRSIFEDVAEAETARPVAEVGVIDRGRGGARGAIRVWLIVLFVLVVVMIAIGGLTRLTDSGLSITKWDLVKGALPPMNEAAWLAEFEKYKAIPQFQIQNQWMELSDFKTIYWWEWGHRQLGRVIGLVWIVGFAVFWLRKQVPAGYTPKLVTVGALIGLQGAIGWWMVSSGLKEGMTSVASYRLATHLGLAFIILGFIAWYIFELSRSEKDLMQARRSKDAKLYGLSTGLLHFTFLQILIGALVAGIDAGRSYTDWPLMGGQVFPATAFTFEPFWRNFFESPGLVQFIHRVTGYLLAGFAVVVWLRGRKSAHVITRGAFNVVIAVMGLQILLGIVTVLYGAPWQIAILHQFVAVVLWVVILRARFLSMHPVATSIRTT